MLFQQIIREEDAADVNKYNTQEPYHMHATATATTRAEARALRKILRLRKVRLSMIMGIFGSQTIRLMRSKYLYLILCVKDVISI